jgi:hypothetical protein
MSGLGRMWANFKYKRAKRIKLRCTCGKRLNLSGEKDKSGKQHAHCPICHLEWHIRNGDGYIYNHPIRSLHP